MMSRILFLFILSFSLFDQTFGMGQERYNFRPSTLARRNIRTIRGLHEGVVVTTYTPIVEEIREEEIREEGFIKRLFNKTFGNTTKERVLRATTYTLAIYGIIKLAGHILQPKDAIEAIESIKETGVVEAVKETAVETVKETGVVEAVKETAVETVKTVKNLLSMKQPSLEELAAHEDCVDREAKEQLKMAISKFGSNFNQSEVFQLLKEKAKRYCYLQWDRIKECIQNKSIKHIQNTQSAIEAIKDQCIKEILS